MTPRTGRLVRLREARELRHAEVWANLLRRVRAVREAAIRRVPAERKADEVRT